MATAAATDNKPAATNTPTSTATGDKPAEGEKPVEGAKPAEGEKPAEGAKPAEGEKPKEGDKPAEGEKPKDGDKPAGAPEKYEFVAPEGVELDADLIGEFEGAARELNLPQDKAQKLVDLGAKIVTKQLEAVAAIRTQWAETSKTDKEFGGEKLPENLAVAKRTLDTFGTPELRQVLNDTGLGNNPELIRLMFRVGKTLAEDGTVRTTQPSAAGKSTADLLYGS